MAGKAQDGLTVFFEASDHIARLACRIPMGDKIPAGAPLCKRTGGYVNCT